MRDAGTGPGGPPAPAPDGLSGAAPEVRHLIDDKVDINADLAMGVVEIPPLDGSECFGNGWVRSRAEDFAVRLTRSTV
jgi:hypothetical protein